MLNLKENTFPTMPAPKFPFNSIIVGLSARQMQVLNLLVSELLDELMASQLGVKTITLHVHLLNIFRIMHVKSLGEAIAKIVSFDLAAPGTIGSLCPQEKT